MQLLMVLNPISGAIDKANFLKKSKQLCRHYGIVLSVFKTSGENDLQKLQEKIKIFQPDKVAAVGGDGTNQLVANALYKSDIPMGLIPLGSANGLAKELGTADERLKALKDLLISSLVIGFDMIEINDQYRFIHLGGLGAHAEIIYKYEQDPGRGMSVYARYLLETLQNTPSFHAKVSVNGKTIDQKLIMLSICNAQRYGTGVPLNLKGHPMDGKFELILIDEIEFKTLLKAGLSKFDERFFDKEHLKVISTEKAQIQLDPPQNLQLDGELIGEMETIKVQILPKAVQLITTQSNPYL